MLISDEEYILSLKGENFDLTEFLLSVCYIFTKSDSQEVRKMISAKSLLLPFSAVKKRIENITVRNTRKINRRGREKERFRRVV